MFDRLTSRLQTAFRNLRGYGPLTEKNVQDAQRVEQELIACAELAQQLDSRMERIYRETLGDQPASIDAELG